MDTAALHGQLRELERQLGLQNKGCTAAGLVKIALEQVGTVFANTPALVSEPILSREDLTEGQVGS